MQPVPNLHQIDLRNTAVLSQNCPLRVPEVDLDLVVSRPREALAKMGEGEVRKPLLRLQQVALV